MKTSFGSKYRAIAFSVFEAHALAFFPWCEQAQNRSGERKERLSEAALGNLGRGATREVSSCVGARIKIFAGVIRCCWIAEFNRALFSVSASIPVIAGSCESELRKGSFHGCRPRLRWRRCFFILFHRFQMRLQWQLFAQATVSRMQMHNVLIHVVFCFSACASLQNKIKDRPG